MKKYQIVNMMVEADTQMMARQLMGLAIKKKHRDKVRPCFIDPTYKVPIEIKEKQNRLWCELSGFPYDY